MLSMTVAVGGAECCILRLPEGQGPTNLEDQKPDQREGNEWYTQDRDAGSANDHHTPVKTSHWRKRHEPNIRETHKTGFLRQGAGTAGERHVDCTDLPIEAEAQTKYKPITQGSCPKWRGPSGKPRSDRYTTSLSFRMGSYVELVDAVALQTKHAL